MLLDRIFSVPNDWVKVISPLIIWMTFHIDDKMVATIFDQTQILKQELSRLHQVLDQFVKEENRKMR